MINLKKKNVKIRNILKSFSEKTFMMKTRTWLPDLGLIDHHLLRVKCWLVRFAKLLRFYFYFFPCLKFRSHAGQPNSSRISYSSHEYINLKKRANLKLICTASVKRLTETISTNNTTKN